MGILNEQAALLRTVAAKLDQQYQCPRYSPKELIRMFANAPYIYTQRIESSLGNEPQFVEHCIKRAGYALGEEIGGKLRATFKGFRQPDPNNPDDYRLWLERVAEYEAKVYVFTPNELETLVASVVKAEQAASL